MLAIVAIVAFLAIFGFVGYIMYCDMALNKKLKAEKEDQEKKK